MIERVRLPEVADQDRVAAAFAGRERDAAAVGQPLGEEKASKIFIKVLDTGGNVSSVQFWVKRSEAMESYVGQPYQYDFKYDVDNKIETADLNLFLPKGVLYESLPFQYHTTPDASSGIYSPIHHLHNGQTPAHRYFDLSLRPYNLPEALRGKAVIAFCGAGARRFVARRHRLPPSPRPRQCGHRDGGPASTPLPPLSENAANNRHANRSAGRWQR